jgi:hypothetical protein
MGHGRGRRNCADFCEKFARYIVIIINCIFFILGIVVVAVGAVLATKSSDLQDQASLQEAILNDLNVVIVALILVICGACIVLTSLCGIVGALKQWRKCLVFYAASLFLILCIQMAMGAYLDNLDESSLGERWRNATPQTRDAIQRYLTCCGWSQLDDTAPFPDCTYPDFSPPLDTCQTKAIDYIKTNIKPVSLAAIVIAVIEFVSMFATCGLIYTSKDLQPGDDFWSSPFGSTTS